MTAMRIPATLVCVVIAASGCDSKKPVPVADAKLADATGNDSNSCELFCIPSPVDGGVACMTGCADAGACPAGCEPVG